jgi:hypothetical protein
LNLHLLRGERCHPPTPTVFGLFIFVKKKQAQKMPKAQKGQRSLAEHRFIHVLIHDTDIVPRCIDFHTSKTFQKLSFIGLVGVDNVGMGTESK